MISNEKENNSNQLQDTNNELMYQIEQHNNEKDELNK